MILTLMGRWGEKEYKDTKTYHARQMTELYCITPEFFKALVGKNKTGQRKPSATRPYS